MSDRAGTPGAVAGEDGTGTGDGSLWRVVETDTLTDRTEYRTGLLPPGAAETAAAWWRKVSPWGLSFEAVPAAALDAAEVRARHERSHGDVPVEYCDALDCREMHRAQALRRRGEDAVSRWMAGPCTAENATGRRCEVHCLNSHCTR